MPAVINRAHLSKVRPACAATGYLQRSAVNANPVAAIPQSVHETLRSQGQPLDMATRAFMEPRFGRDFSHVRVHADARAVESANSVNALAYTVGNHVVFGEGQFAPAAKTGQRLLAHELAHVSQQDTAAMVQLQRQSKEGTAVPAADNDMEKKANEAADKNAANQPETDLEKPEPVERQPSPKKIAACDRNILAEGTCAELVARSKYICCDPKNGIKRDDRKKDIDGQQCPDQKFTPIFTCDSTCDKALENGCSDSDNWIAIPGDRFKRSACDDEYTICANGKQTKGYVRDKSVTASFFEVSPRIQNLLGVPVGSSFMGAVYRPGAKQATIDKDACCNS